MDELQGMYQNSPPGKEYCALETSAAQFPAQRSFQPLYFTHYSIILTCWREKLAEHRAFINPAFHCQFLTPFDRVLCRLGEISVKAPALRGQ